MNTIITDYLSRERDIRYVRDQVFVIEQEIDRDEEFDDRDPLCIHSVVYENDQPIATGRIDLEKGAKIGRVAVLREYRRRGLGTLIMESLEELAIERAQERVWFHAQTYAIPFYEGLGYRVCSEEFEEANIPHVLMEKSILPHAKENTEEVES